MVILFSVILLAVSALIVPFIGTEFMPKTETREFTMDIRMSEGTRLERTSSAVENIENIVTELLGDNLETVYSEIGPSTRISSTSTSIFEGENTATVKIILKADSRITSYNVCYTKLLRKIEVEVELILVDGPISL